MKIRPGEGTLLGENLNHSFISEASCLGLRVGVPKESNGYGLGILRK
jgi:hypothetical protein